MASSLAKQGFEKKESKWTKILWILLALWGISMLLSYFADSFAGRKIQIIPIEGMLVVSSAGFAFDSSTSSQIVDEIKSAGENNNVIGVVLEINTEGGTVFASKEIADAVKALKEKKPVIAVIKEVGTSGGYWIASAADFIIADPLSITGSLGVRGSFLQFSGLLQRYGVSYEKITAGEFKELGNPFTNLSEKERALIQDEVNKIYDYFITDIAENRKMEKERLLKLATGEIFLGFEAKENGLVDELGSTELAVKIIKERTNITDAEIERITSKRGMLDILSKFTNSAFYHFGVGLGSTLKIKQEGLRIFA